jgi:hypothetical protein
MWVDHPAFDSDERFRRLVNIFCASPWRPKSVDLYTGHIWQSRNHDVAWRGYSTMDSDMVAGFQKSDFSPRPGGFVVAVGGGGLGLSEGLCCLRSLRVTQPRRRLSRDLSDHE